MIKTVYSLKKLDQISPICDLENEIDWKFVSEKMLRAQKDCVDRFYNIFLLRVRDRDFPIWKPGDKMQVINEVNKVFKEQSGVSINAKREWKKISGTCNRSFPVVKKQYYAMVLQASFDQYIQESLNSYSEDKVAVEDANFMKYLKEMFDVLDSDNCLKTIKFKT